jgi:transcription initiation factor TFIIIB Brf1 subunit/transcription initiation factor TFIIB
MDDYISLLKYPDIEATEKDEFIGYLPEDLIAFKRNLENIRQQFLSQLADNKDEDVINGYLSELKTIVSNLEMKATPRDAMQDIIGLGKEGDTVMQRVSQALLAANLVDREVVASANKTIEFIERFLVDEEEEDSVNRETVVVKETPIEATPEQQKPDTISGTKGLAKYLGCSPTMANAIIQDGILKRDKIQYRTGRIWKFNRVKLDEFLAKHPEALSKIRCKH